MWEPPREKNRPQITGKKAAALVRQPKTHKNQSRYVFSAARLAGRNLALRPLNVFSI